MEGFLISLIKVAGVTVIIGQALKVIDKREFKALVDFCGVASCGIIIMEGFMKFKSSPTGDFISNILKHSVIFNPSNWSKIVP